MSIPEEVIKHANQEGISDTHRNMYLRSWEYPFHYLKAVKAKCIECVGFEDVTNRVRGCDIIICPLHKLRHLKPKEECSEEPGDGE